MSRLKTYAVGLAALLLCAATPRGASVSPRAQGPPVRDAGAAWRQFSPPEGRFAVRLPGDPVTSTQQVETSDGWLPMRVYTHAASVQFIVSYMDYARALEDPKLVERFFAGVRNGALRATGATLLEESEVTLAGYPGRYFRMRLRGGLVGRARAYLVKKRLYQLLFIAREEGMTDADIQFNNEAAGRFFDSFRLIPDRPAAERPGADPPAANQPAAAGLMTDACPAGAADVAADDAGGEEEVAVLLEQRGRLKGEKIPLVVGSFDDAGAQAARPGGRAGVGKAVAVRALSKPAPAYPPGAVAARARGAVVVQIVVDTGGRVIAAQALCGHARLRAAAVEAVRLWRFSPALIDGQPVLVTGVVNVNFNPQ